MFAEIAQGRGFVFTMGTFPPRTMSEVAKRIVEEAITQTQESTGTISGKEFGTRVEDQVEQTTTALREQFGEAADAIVGDTTATVTGYKQQLDELVGENNVGDTEKVGAAGYVERASKTMVLSKRHTDLEVDNRGYRERVLQHETVHQQDQAAQYNSQTITALDDNTGELVEFSVVGDLTEGQAIRKSGQPDGDLVPEYVEHRQQEGRLASIVGESRIDEALKSGDTESLQQEIIERQREQILANLMSGQGMPGELN